MYNSLQRIKSLPKNTLIYCAHEYTKSNLLWALDLEPENQNLKNKLIDVEKKISLKELTIPCLLEEEMKINLFLSCLLYTSPSPRDRQKSRMPSSA